MEKKTKVCRICGKEYKIGFFAKNGLDCKPCMGMRYKRIQANAIRLKSMG